MARQVYTRFGAIFSGENKRFQGEKERRQSIMLNHAPLVPLKVVYRGSVTKPCTPTLRGQGDTKVSQQF